MANLQIQHADGSSKIAINTLMKLQEFTGRERNVLKAIFHMTLGQKLRVTMNRRSKTDLFLSVIKPGVRIKGSPEGFLPCLFSSVEVYALFNTSDDLQDFVKSCGNTFKDIALVSFLDKCGANFTDLRILCRYVTCFFLDEGPITLLDIGLSNQEVIELTDRIYNGRFLLETQELIELKKERSGIYLDGAFTSRLIKLLKGDDISIHTEGSKKNRGLYFDIHNNHIKSCELFYNKHEQRLFDHVSALLAQSRSVDELNVSILLYGPPGTGKTEFAYQIGRKIGADIMQMNFSEIHSKWIGETEKNIRSVFEKYKQKRQTLTHPLILLINEADGLMNRRVGVSISNDAFHNQAQTQLLELLEDFKGVVIATTNLYQNIDEAFHRRFLFRQAISLPDLRTRELILANSPISRVISPRFREKVLESSWGPAQIKNIELKLKQLSVIQAIDESLIELLMTQDEMLIKKRKLGFVQKNNRSIPSQPEQIGGYI